MKSVRSYLKNPIDIQVDTEGLDLRQVTALAKRKASEFCNDPMLLAWFNGQSGDYSPRFECGKIEAPPWIVFADARGGDITISINQEEYVFIFLSIQREGRSIQLKPPATQS